MYWSKRSPDNGGSSRPTTTWNPMEHGPTALTAGCREGSVVCDGPNQENFCSGHGLCCHHSNDSNQRYCVCNPGWTGTYCQNQLPEYSMDNYRPTQAIVAFSAILGLIVITLFIVLIVLQIKYYRRRKKHFEKEHDHELISRPDARESDIISKRRLATQPGYSWRESVRRVHSKASHKLRSALSRSVPEDLFQVGLKMAFVGGWKPNDQQLVAGKAEVKGVATLRCFSAGPDLGEGSHPTSVDSANASDRPSVVPMPASGATSTEAEDTVK